MQPRKERLLTMQRRKRTSVDHAILDWKRHLSHQCAYHVAFDGCAKGAAQHIPIDVPARISCFWPLLSRAKRLCEFMSALRIEKNEHGWQDRAFTEKGNSLVRMLPKVGRFLGPFIGSTATVHESLPSSCRVSLPPMSSQSPQGAHFRRSAIHAFWWGLAVTRACSLCCEHIVAEERATLEYVD